LKRTQFRLMAGWDRYANSFISRRPRITHPAPAQRRSTAPPQSSSPSTAPRSAAAERALRDR
jgi:hypothetical protein